MFWERILIMSINILKDISPLSPIIPFVRTYCIEITTDVMCKSGYLSPVYFQVQQLSPWPNPMCHRFL